MKTYRDGLLSGTVLSAIIGLSGFGISIGMATNAQSAGLNPPPQAPAR
jgi:hypothetical protein